MSNAILAWSLVFTMSIFTSILSWNSINVIEAAAQKQGNSTSVHANNNTNLTNEGVSLLVLGKYNEAISLFDKVLAVEPNNILALTNKATALVYLQKYNEAITLFDKALVREPNNTGILDSKVMLLFLYINIMKLLPYLTRP